MPDFDLIIRNGTVVTSSAVRAADLAIAEGKLQLLPPGQTAQARETLDASGLHIFHGVIDSHVHFNEPGRADWEGFATGSRAFAAGGGTLFFDMPLNAHPPTLDAASFDQKLAAAQATSLVDFSFWGGLVPGNVDRMEELAQRGVVGFKAFMSNSGIEDFPRADDKTLKAGMKRAAALRKLVAVHAESETVTSELAQKAAAAGKTGMRDYLDSRPIHAELEAIQRALELAGETRCALHIVHVSCGAGLALVASAQKLGVDVTCETCPHYLALTEENMVQLGAVAKCAPPLRAKPAQAGLWEYLLTGQITTVGSDHSPSPASMKQDPNFFKVWGGISGVQHTLPLLITEGHVNRAMALPLISNVTAYNVAQRFNLPATKGEIADRMDADLVLVDMKQEFEVRSQDLLYRHQQSPYVHRKLTGKVVRTILRGTTVFSAGRIVSEPVGRLVKPEVTDVL
jgi:allantoinase